MRNVVQCIPMGADITFTSCLIPTKQTKTAKGSKENRRHVQ